MKSLSIIHVLSFAIAAALLGAYFVLSQPQLAKGSVVAATPIGAATTTAATSITTSTRIMATTTNPLGVPGETSFTRVYAVVCNTSATPVALNLDADKAANATTGNVTTFIAAAAGYDACYEITDRNQYSGSVTASSTAGAVTVYSKQYVQ